MSLAHWRSDLSNYSLKVVLQMEKELLAFLEKKHGTRFVSRLNHCFNHHFGSLDLKNRSVLEIGAGPGYLAALCLARGACRVVALDPESNGATEGINKQFSRLTESVAMGDGIEYLPISLEKFIATGRKEIFDYVLMCNVINHIDEDAVKRLHLPNADRERKRYVRTLEEIHNLLSETGTLLVSDVGRYNFWNSIGLRFPACRTIEWDKHQDPDVWKALLSKAGFESIEVKWLALYRLRYFKAIVSLKPVAQCLNSHFLISARKQKGTDR
jgi:SAM-dependent methyltransferase